MQIEEVDYMIKRERLISAILFLLYLETINASNNCTWSTRNLELVSLCPVTFEEREDAAFVKKCKALSLIQTCSEPFQFKYHCVASEKENVYMEVCAPEVEIRNGFCATFNPQTGQLESHAVKQCVNATRPCPERYVSSDSYLYPFCYGLNDITNVKEITTASSAEVYDFSHTTAILLVLMGFILSTIAIMSFIKRKQLMKLCTRRTDERNTNTEEHKVRKIKDARRGFRAALRDNAPGADEENRLLPKDDSETRSDNISLVSADSISDLIAAFRADFLNRMQRSEATESRNVTLEDIKNETLAFLNDNSLLDRYFVETEYYRKAKSTLEEQGVVILTGPPGYGKTSTAIHLMKDSLYVKWAIYKIASWSDFRLLDLKSNTLIFVENVFGDYASMHSHDVSKWWDQFTRVLLTYKKKSENSDMKVRILVTAKENVIQKACEFTQQNSYVFKAENIIDAKTIQLSYREKEEILKRQIDYAYEQKQIEKPALDLQLIQNKSFKSQGPIGFALCANLYACEKECRKYGGNFFFLPMVFFKTHIETLIKSDFTGKIRTLLLLLFLQETSENEITHFVDLQSEEDCRAFLVNLKLISQKKLLTILKSYDPDSCEVCEKWLADIKVKDHSFNSLRSEAEKLTAFLLMNSHREGCYQFRHKSIFDAVGNYFLVEEFNVAIRAFPIEAFERQDVDGLSEKQFLVLASRYTYEIRKGNSSKVCLCNGMQHPDLSLMLTKILKSQESLRKLLLVTDIGTFAAPFTFWITRNKLYTLSELILDIIVEENIDVEFHLYMNMLGDCCQSNENVLQNLDVKTFSSMELAGRFAMTFRDEKSNSVLHLNIMSNRKDSHVCKIIRNLSKSEKELDCEIWNSKNTDGETLLNCSAKCGHKSRILSMLSLFEIETIDVNTKDSNGFTPLHNSVVALVSGNFSGVKNLELLVRLCILRMYGADPNQLNQNEDRAIDLCKNTKYKRLCEILDIGSKSESMLVSIIETSLKELDSREGERNMEKIPNPRGRLCERMLKALKNSVIYLEHADFA